MVEFDLHQELLTICLILTGTIFKLADHIGINLLFYPIFQLTISLYKKLTAPSIPANENIIPIIGIMISAIFLTEYSS